MSVLFHRSCEIGETARGFTANSWRALKLALAAREHEPDNFETLNQRLYEAFFLKYRNIGDPQELRALAAECRLSPGLPGHAWSDPAYDDALRDNQRSAISWGAAATPTYVFGENPYRRHPSPHHASRRGESDPVGPALTGCSIQPMGWLSATMRRAARLNPVSANAAMRTMIPAPAARNK